MTTIGKIAVFFAVIVALFVIGQFGTPFARSFFIEIIIWSLLAMSFNILYGYTGLLSFGQSLFFGIGCYSFALSIIYWHTSIIFAISISILSSLLVAMLTGLLIIRTSSHYFIIVSVLLSLIPFYLANHMVWLTGGDDGIPVQLPSTFFLTSKLSPYNEIHMYWFITTFVLIVLFFCFRLVSSPTALVFKAIRENELKAGFIGYNTQKYKFISWTIAGVLAGLSGCLYVLAFKYTSSAFFQWTLSADAVIWCIFGGVGTFLGPIIGTFAFLMIKDELSSRAEYYPTLVGAILIILMRLKPSGINGLLMPIYYRTIFNQKKGIKKSNEINIFPDWEKSEQNNILEIEDLEVSFDGIYALKKISLAITSTELKIRLTTPYGNKWFVEKNDINLFPCLIFIGPNGAGKSTFFNALTGVHSSAFGLINIFGQKVLSKTKSVSKFKFRPFGLAALGLSRTFQQVQLFRGLTVEENLRIATQYRLIRSPLISSSSQIVYRDIVSENILELIHLEEEGQKVASSLSYGRQKMLEIGLAVASGGKIILLDEPTAGVSPNEVTLIINLIIKLRSHYSILVIEHDLEVIKRLGFTTCIMADGELIAAGEPEKIMHLAHVKDKFHVS